MFDLLDTLVGAALPTLAYAVGKRRERSRKPVAPTEPEAVCNGCEHHHSMHRHDAGGGCNAVDSRYVGSGTYKDVPCRCVKYSGPTPLPTYISGDL